MALTFQLKNRLLQGVVDDAVLIPLDYDGVTSGAAVISPSSISEAITFSATSLAY